MKARIQLVLALVLVLAGTLVVVRWFRTPDRLARGQAIEHRELALKVLGEYLAQHHAGAQVVVLQNPFAARSGQPAEVYAFEEAALRGLKRGWGERMRLVGVVSPELDPAAARDPSAVPMPADTTTPLSFLTVPGSWDRCLRSHPEVEVVVSLIGLPVDLREQSVWTQPKPVLALLLPDLRPIGDAASVRAALGSGKLAAMVLNRPGAPPESAAPAADDRAEFERRFLLVTSGNWEAVAALYPGLF